MFTNTPLNHYHLNFEVGKKLNVERHIVQITSCVKQQIFYLFIAIIVLYKEFMINSGLLIMVNFCHIFFKRKM